MNKDNNDINNLIAISQEEHLKIHLDKLSVEQRDWYRKNLNENARPKAVEWHKSKLGRDWHKEQYKKTLGNRDKETFICSYCGEEYKQYNKGVNKFCSNKCKSAWRRESGLDDEERKCIICWKKYICNKYSKKTKCDDCTPEKYKKNRKR